jgi:gamma-glutamylaminecyclotransferase
MRSTGLVKLFVYGSLLKGQSNHGRLMGSRWIAACRTEPSYTLVDLGDYPALLEGGTMCVAGEVYEVDNATLASIDAFEGHPGLYKRSPVRLEGGETVVGYLLRCAELARGRAVVESGDWRARAR